MLLEDVDAVPHRNNNKGLGATASAAIRRDQAVNERKAAARCECAGPNGHAWSGSRANYGGVAADRPTLRDTAIVRRHGGSINKSIGSACKVFTHWGRPANGAERIGVNCH